MELSISTKLQGNFGNQLESEALNDSPNRKRSGASSNNGPGKPNNNNNGSGGDDDDNGIPQYSKPESVETTQERFQKIQEQVVKLEEVTDSDSVSMNYPIVPSLSII